MTNAAITEDNIGQTIRTSQIIRRGISLLTHSLGRAWSAWLLAAVLFTGTDLIDMLYGGPKFHFSPLIDASLAGRVFASFWVGAAAARAYAGYDGTLWALNRNFWRYAAASLFLLVATFASIFAVAHLARPFIHALAANIEHAKLLSIALTAATLIAFSIMTIRFTLWIIALAIGDRTVTVFESWRRMRGATLGAIGALLAIVPIIVAHFGLTLWAQSLDGEAQVWTTIVDGIVSVFQVMLGLAFTVAVYKLTAERTSTG